MSASEEEEEQIWIRVEALSQNAERGSDLLWMLGAQGVEVRDGETFFEGDPEFAPIPDGRARLVSYFALEEEDTVEALTERLEEALTEHTTLVAAARFDDRSWETKWREFFTPRHLSSRAIVGPPWEDFDAPEGGHRIIVEPGMAFGTGTHETTQLVSQVLEDLLDNAPTQVERMLDVGCGSGILCIHAHSLGVKHLVGIDIADEAIENAEHNLTLNGKQDADIDFSTTPLGDIEGTWPLVVANILAHILVMLSEELIAHTAPGGTLVLSGILEHQLADIREAFGQDETLEEVGQRNLGEWFSITYRRA